MEKIEAYRYRGTVYETKEALQKELDGLLGKIITSHAHKLAQIDKYSATTEYLAGHLDDFHEAYLLQEDMRALKDL